MESTQWYLQRLIEIVERLEKKLELMEVKVSQQLDNLAAQVKRNSDITSSAVQLIQGITAQLQAVRPKYKH